MISDIQHYRFNFYKNKKGYFSYKNIIIYILVYILVSYFFYYFIIQPKKSLLEGFFFASITYLIADGNFFWGFDAAVPHLPILLYDSFVVGGVCMLLSQYLMTNFYTTTLQHYTVPLFVLYVASMALFFYSIYLYNPDLSNIQGIVLF